MDLIGLTGSVSGTADPAFSFTSLGLLEEAPYEKSTLKKITAIKIAATAIGAT